MLRDSVQIAPIEPALTPATPGKIIGFGDILLGRTSSAIVHFRLRSGRCGATGWRSSPKDPAAVVLPATLRSLPDHATRVPIGARWNEPRRVKAARLADHFNGGMAIGKRTTEEQQIVHGLTPALNARDHLAPFLNIS